jgi:CP family cyanate transporter-like MFS transporter
MIVRLIPERSRGSALLDCMPSAFLLPWLVQRFGNRYVWLVACGVVSSVSLAMITFVSTCSPEFWAVSIGFSLGGSFALSLVLPLYEAGSPLAVSRWTVMMLCMGYSVACLTPVLTGLARDLAGHYQLPFMVLASLALLMTALAWVMRRGPRLC